tara:strand:- start:1403 stop:1981 length:579 start_codon:yes stop_codon:yes gene_type:complete
MIEQWCEIFETEGRYKVSNLGRVVRVAFDHPAKNGAVCSLPEKILIPQLMKIGYECVGIRSDGKHQTKYVHRLVAAHFVKNNDSRTQVNHIDGNKANNNYLNLEWCTPSENSQHAYDTGLAEKSLLGIAGDDCKNTKYTYIASMDGLEIKMTGNIQMAENGFTPSGVCNAYKNKSKHKGFSFGRVVNASNRR